MPMNTCNKHPSMQAERHCQQCSKPVCVKCIVNERFCSEACNQKFRSFIANYKKPGDTSRSPIPGVIFFLAVVGGLYFLAKKMGWLPW
ncbi:MAG TPA: B-box zinc finger protein [Planctomycetota bacterium]|nr:B-box zinc finger protein [Planctomycetota bacterium]